MQRTVLSVGTNLSLLHLRNAVFAEAGYRTIAARSCAQALKSIGSQQVDAVVLGHSMSRRLQQRLLQAAKAAGCVVIALHTNAYEEPLPHANANLCGIDGAATIIDVLRKLLPVPTLVIRSEVLAETSAELSTRR